MEKLVNYKEILRQELEKHTAARFANAPNLKQQLIINKDETIFIVLKSGWVDYLYRHSITFHFEIKEGRIHLYKNNTDIDIGERLVRQGVVKSDIILEFVNEYERSVEGYGVA